MQLITMKLTVTGDTKEEIIANATEMAREFFGHDSFRCGVNEVRNNPLSGNPLAVAVGIATGKRWTADVRCREVRSRAGGNDSDEDDFED